MKIIAIVLGVIIVIIIIFLALALFIKKEYSVSREIIINKPNAQVFEYLRHLKNQDHYSKWVMTDPKMKKEFKGTDGTVGFIYAWNGNKQAGEGEQQIIDIKEGNRIDVEVRFKRPFKAVAVAPMITEPVSANQTRVIWGMNGKYSYPMNFMNLFVDKLLGKDIETSLNTLKTILEKSNN